MTNKELQNYLSVFADHLEVKIMIDHSDQFVKEMDSENILFTSETAHVNSDAPEDEWDHEDGKIELGKGKRYLLINPIIL